MEKMREREAKRRNLRFGVVLFLILGFGASFILTGCGTQVETKAKGEPNSGPPSTEQKQGGSLPDSPSSNVSSPSGSSSSGSSTSQAAEGTTSLSPESMISSSQLDAGIKAKKDWTVIDVREISEFATGHVPTAKNIPLGRLEQNLNQFPENKEIILVCLNGQRAFTAWQTLISKGYDPKKVKVLIGGMEQWKSLGSGEVTESIGGC